MLRNTKVKTFLSLFQFTSQCREVSLVRNQNGNKWVTHAFDNLSFIYRLFSIFDTFGYLNIKWHLYSSAFCTEKKNVNIICITEVYNLLLWMVWFSVLEFIQCTMYRNVVMFLLKSILQFLFFPKLYYFFQIWCLLKLYMEMLQFTRTIYLDY